MGLEFLYAMEFIAAYERSTGTTGTFNPDIHALQTSQGISPLQGILLKLLVSMAVFAPQTD